VVSDDNLHHIDLNTTLNIDILGLANAQSLNLKSLLLDLRDLTLESGEPCIIGNHQMVCAVNYVRDVEILRVIARNEIWVNIYDEITPGFEHIVLSFETIHMCTNNLGAAFKSENVPNNGF
jgi:hypothetical protein